MRGLPHRDRGRSRSARILRILAISLLSGHAVPAGAQDALQFIGMEETADADKALRIYLQQKAGLQFQTHSMGKNAAVRRLADWRSGERYLAHMTPYACVAAEMLGASFDILATYHSKATEDTIYHAFFVLNKHDFNERFRRDPDLADLPRYLKERQPVKFVYHDRLSTSSYFLPSLHFQAQHVFAVSESAGGSLTPILLEKGPPGSGSSYSIAEVAMNHAQLAAVAEDSKKRNEEKYGNYVYFVQLPIDIPNDLLVISKQARDSGGDPLKEKILKAIRETTGKTNWRPKEKDESVEKKIEEFLWWVDINEAPKALDALGELRRLSGQTTHYVTVAVHWLKDQAPQSNILRAVEHGVRLAGTEFVLYDKDFHKRVDVTWELQSIHDGAILLTSQIGEAGLVEPQQFSVSFMNTNDLTTRIADIVQSRMHRIRYVWPYQDNYPAIIRDFEFVPQPTVTVQRILWTDPDRNEYEEGIPFEARITRVEDLHKLQLSEGLFPRGQEGAFQFEPMSNVAYRVVLRRPSAEAPLFAILTGVFVACLVLALLAVVWDLRRKRPAPVGFAATCQRLVEKYHEPWREREVRHADVLWCDPQIDEYIRSFRTRTVLSQEVGQVRVPWIGVSLDALKWAFGRVFGEMLKMAPELADSSEVGSTAALERLIKYLVRSGKLSLFTGTPVEWDALEEIARGSFRRLGIIQAAADAHFKRDAGLAGIVSRHIQDVLENTKRASLFLHHWELTERADTYRLTHKEDLGGDIQLVLKEGPAICRTLVLEFEIPRTPEFRESLQAVGGRAWLLGRIQDAVHYCPAGGGQFEVKFLPLAVLKPLPASEVVVIPKPMTLAAGAG